ncbi:hypothetical protein [Prescottella agglutinans]|uniref:Uncharacterized protein n=1 Tax=Prescottella agglutinans TaxID=1644129 RepID=A0ABT6MN16_9NOCA|nr:hypothetical protein [Prescottella agglutinans]MDH6285099.1 hypothetical protein [Prescottella agglutinans]
MLSADVDVRALMCTPGAGEGEVLVSPYAIDDHDKVLPSLQIRTVTVV